jgi:hypothetical protein
MLGIAANTAIFTECLTEACLQPLPYGQARPADGSSGNHGGQLAAFVAPANFLDWRREGPRL